MPHSRSPQSRRHPAPLLAALLAVMATLAQAQAPAGGVYRCGSSYSDAPCPGGQPVATDDGRSAAQRQQALQVKRDEAAQADRLAAERRAREQAAAGQRAAGIGPTAAETAAAAASQAKAQAKAKAPKPKARRHKPKSPQKA